MLDVSKNLKLETLLCDYNYGISELDISNNSHLKVLSCANLSSIEVMDLSNCPDLEELNLESTGVSSVDVTGCPKLKSLNVSFTHVSSIDVTKNPDLEKLIISGCMNDDWEYCIEDVDVSHNPKLKDLEVAMTNITSLDVTNNPELEILYAYITPLTTLDISNNNKLVRLDLNNTQISSIDVKDKSKLFALNLEMTKVSEIDVTHNPELFEIYLTGDKAITELDLTKNPNMTHLRVSGTSLTELDLTKNAKLQAFYNYRHNEDDPVTWESVTVEPAPIQSYDFSKNPKMYEIYLDGANVSELNVSNMPTLRHLSLNDTNIAKLDVSNNTRLVSLKVDNTPLSSLNISKNTNLRTFSFSNTSINNLKNLDFTGYKILSLEAENAGVESVVFDSTDSVHNVNLNNNAIAEIDLEGRQNPNWYYCSFEADNQNITVEVPKEQIEARKIYLKDIFENPSRVTVTDGSGYTYNSEDGSITFDEGSEMVFKYTYDTKFGSYSDSFDVTATIAEETNAELDSHIRIFGNNRYETSLKSADKLRELHKGRKFNTVVLATGTNFADALAGGYLANMNDAPIILVNPKDEDSAITYVKKNLKTGGKVYILGGENSVSSNVNDKLSSASFDVKRLAGNTRYETNIAILEEAGVSGGEIIVCNGAGFADSLSASAVNEPILLVDNNSGKFNTLQNNFISTLDRPSFMILGGTSSVSKSFENSISEIGSVDRLGGSSRYATSRLIAEHYFPTAENVVLVYGGNFPDGLSGSALANAINGPVLLMDSRAANTEDAAKYYKASGAKFSIVLGGTTMISDSAWNRVIK